MSVAVLDAFKWFANVGLLVEASVKKTPLRGPNRASLAAATPIVPVDKISTGSFWNIAEAFAAMLYSDKPWLSLF
tara:strand:- start:313 stop:537 length:225 start_codon:yes stop_codon:yes gene_type:complete